MSLDASMSIRCRRSSVHGAAMSTRWLKAPNGTACSVLGADNSADNGARVATDEEFSG